MFQFDSSTIEFYPSRPTTWLLYGDLLCISIDGSFQEPVWAVVENHIVQQRLVVIVSSLSSIRLLCLFFGLGGGGGELVFKGKYRYVVSCLL